MESAISVLRCRLIRGVESGIATQEFDTNRGVLGARGGRAA